MAMHAAVVEDGGEWCGQVMLHHAIDAELVRYGGCCRSSECSFKIGSNRNDCVSTESFFELWADKVRKLPTRERSGTGRARPFVSAVRGDAAAAGGGRRR